MTTLWHSDTPHRRTTSHAPEGPRAAPSCDGYAASLTAAGSREHVRDVLSTSAERLEVGSSVRAESDDSLLQSGMAVRHERREPLIGVRERVLVLATAVSRRAKHHRV